jgi:methylmalonyl-CoA mutase
MTNTASAAALLESAVPGQPIHLAEGFDAARLDHWRTMVDKALKGADFDKRLIGRTADGVAVRPLYTRTDSVFGSDTELPGAAPFTRGRTAMREGLGWDIRAFHSETDAKAANAAILEDLEGGVNSIALHVRPNALPATPDALMAALDGVLLDVCPITLVADDNTYNAALALNAVWEARGIAAKDRQGHYGANPLGMLAVTGRLEEDYETALARAVALLALSRASPGVTALTVDGVCFHNAGASEAQELAAMLSTLVAYLRAGERPGFRQPTSLQKPSLHWRPMRMSFRRLRNCARRGA